AVGAFDVHFFMDIRFTGKCALVTGAAGGIGKGVAIKLSECGAKVIVFDKDEQSLKQLKNEVTYLIAN
ncbi:L-xylulose reductase-like protein, partial [Leptotrombidium deliense]